MSTLTHEERNLLQRYAALCHGAKTARVSPAGRELQGLRRGLSESRRALKEAVLELYPWEQQERRSFDVALTPTDYLSVRIVQSQRAVTPHALASAVAGVDSDEVEAKMRSDENDVTERSVAEDRLAAWWNCSLTAAHTASVTWTPVVAMHTGPPPPGARVGSERIVEAADRVREIEQQLADTPCSQPPSLPATLQAELLPVLRRNDGIVPRVEIEDQHGTSRYRIMMKQGVRRQTLTPAFLRRASIVDAHATDVERLMECTPPERIAHATALLEKIREASTRCHERVTMVDDRN